MTERLTWALLAYMLGILSFLCGTINTVIWVGVTSVTGLIFLCVKRKLVLSWLALIVLFFFLGLGNVSLRVFLGYHPVLSRPFYQTPIRATVAENQPLMEKQIVTLTDIYWKNPDLKMPQKIKVHFNKTEPLLHEGDKVSALVSVYPPDKNFSPAYYYQLWFSDIGATGVADEIQILASSINYSSLFELRSFINHHLFQILPKSQAEIAAPLMTGEQKLVSRETYQLYRRAGIAHVLSVSGFHMALLSGFLFFLIRSILAFFPRIVLYYNTKKIAAIIAFFGTFLYLALSGFQIPAVRAFLMISLVFLGVLVERPVLSMHSLIVIAFVLLIAWPFLLLSISFQLSFMAVAVLVAFYCFLENRLWPKFIKIIVGFLGLNLCVTMALTPLIVYHFHQLMPYSILGNMLFSGTFSFMIMPLLFTGVLLMPFELDYLFFKLAGLGLDFVHWGSLKIVSLPHSEIMISSFSSWAVILISFGILMCCWMRTPLRLLGFFVALIGMVMGILP